MVNPINNSLSFNKSLYNNIKKMTNHKYQNINTNPSKMNNKGQMNYEAMKEMMEWNSAVQGLRGRGELLYTAAFGLKKIPNNVLSSGMKTSSSNVNIATAKALDGATAGSFDVSINKLAQGLKVSGASQIDATSSLNLSGDFKINGATFSVSSAQSLTDIKNMINDKGLGVDASININNELILASKTTGALSSFTVEDISTTINNTLSSDTNVAVIDTLYSEADWTHDINVTQLAEQHQMVGDAQVDATSSLGLSGKFDVNGVAIDIVDGDSLTAIKDKINLANVGVSATLDSMNKLVLTSIETGVVNAISLTDLTSDGNTLSSTDTSIATTNTLITNVDFTNTVEVTQLASVTKQDGLELTTSGGGNIGETWTKQTTGSANSFYYSDSDGSTHVSVGANGQISYSSDGVNWTTANSGTTENLWGVKWTGSEYIAVGDNGTMVKSTDGATWSSVNTGSAASIQSVDGNGSQYVAVGGNGAILTSSDGSSWTEQASPVTGTLNNVNWMGDKWLATGDNNTILTSTDGVNWTTQASPIKQGRTTLTGNTTDGSTMVVVGQSGSILTSTDGVNWTEQTSGTTSDLWDVKHVGGEFVAAGSNGTVLTSVDGVNWTNKSTGGSETLYGVSGTSGQWAVSGSSGGTIYTSEGSGTLFSDHTSDVANGGMTIASTSDGTQTFSVSFADAGITSSTDLKTGMNMLANAINSDASNYGITASVVEDATNGTVKIQLQTNNTGSTSDFSVSGDTMFMADSGLNDASLHTAGVNANYTVDGVAYTDSSNTGVLVEDTSTGTDHATIDLKNLGTTTISNNSTNDVLADLGVLSTDGSIKNQTQDALDAKFSIDGGIEQVSSTNQDILLKDASTGTNQATVDLVGLGTTTISNTKTTSDTIMQDIGLIDNNNNYLNVLQQAQDAEYQIDGGTTQTSTDNTIINNNIEVSLKGIGATTISAEEGEGISGSELETSYNQIVDFIGEYNNTINYIEGNTKHIKESTKDEIRESINNNKNNLNEIGIRENKEGILEIDSTKLSNAIKNNIEKVRETFLDLTSGISNNTLDISAEITKDPYPYAKKPPTLNSIGTGGTSNSSFDYNGSNLLDYYL